jgi:hypothetical protein
MCQCLFDLVHKHKAQVTCLQSAQGGVDGQEFTADFTHVLHARRIRQPLTQQLQHLAIGATTLTGILKQDDLIKGLPQDDGLLADVFVTPVTGATDHHRPALGWQGVHR